MKVHFICFHLLFSLPLIVSLSLSTLESPTLFYINSYVTMWYDCHSTFQVQFNSALRVLQSSYRFLRNGCSFLKLQWLFLTSLVINFLVPQAWRNKEKVLKFHWECASSIPKQSHHMSIIPKFTIILVSLDLRHLTLRCINYHPITARGTARQKPPFLAICSFLFSFFQP